VSVAHGAAFTRGEPESVGAFWKVYPLRESGKALRFSVVALVATNTFRKCRIPAEHATREARASFARGAAHALKREYDDEQREAREREAKRATESGVTFDAFARTWTSGELRKLYPAHVRAKKSFGGEVTMLNVLKPWIGDVALRAFRVEDAERALAKLQENDPAPATLRRYAQTIHRVCALAVYPAKLIATNPLPKGFLPRGESTKAKSYVYPTEDAMLLAKRTIPLARRVFFGFLAREGLRVGEALALEWTDLDLVRGAIRLDENKTDDPRAWALGADVARALAAWRKLNPKASKVFPDLQADRGDLAHALRTDLQSAGVDRAELFAKTKDRVLLRVHDLRASFVTLALANGRTEAWVQDRTGHRSSQMVNVYRRQARMAAELGLGWFAPLDASIPELAPPPSAKAAGPRQSRRPSRVSRARPRSAAVTSASAAKRAESAANGGYMYSARVDESQLLIRRSRVRVPVSPLRSRGI
jgi:integrase